MSEAKQITLPVLGMTCANCVAAVERNAKKVTASPTPRSTTPARRSPSSSTRRSDAAATNQVIDRIQQAGYDVPTAAKSFRCWA